jgi:hypothetical protein
MEILEDAEWLTLEDMLEAARSFLWSEFRGNL